MLQFFFAIHFRVANTHKKMQQQNGAYAPLSHFTFITYSYALFHLMIFCCFIFNTHKKAIVEKENTHLVVVNSVFVTSICSQRCSSDELNSMDMCENFPNVVGFFPIFLFISTKVCLKCVLYKL